MLRRAEAMYETGERPLGDALAKHLGGLDVGVPAVDDERQAGQARRRDMGLEHRALLVARAMVVVEVEAGLANADDLGMARPLDEVGGRGRRLVGRLVRMD